MADKQAIGYLYSHLRRQGIKYRKRGSAKDSRGLIKNKVSIKKQPNIVDYRSRFGDLEVNLIIGKKHKEAKVVKRIIVELLEDWKPFIKTKTSDNGKEFAGHEFVAEMLNIDYYFANAYHSWERGSNENLNGLIRLYIPKKRLTLAPYLTHALKKSKKNLIVDQERDDNYEMPIFVMEKLLFNQKVAFVT